jgi:hypothetical protein
MLKRLVKRRGELPFLYYNLVSEQLNPFSFHTPEIIVPEFFKFLFCFGLTQMIF